MTDASRISLSVPSRLELLDMIQGAAEESARLAGFDEDARLDFGLAVREGAANAMKHAHGLQAQQPVDLAFEIEPSAAVAVSILDRGPGFDPEAAPDPCAPENILNASGRGLFLIRSLVDEVSFRHLDTGMELRMVKRVAGQGVVAG